MIEIFKTIDNNITKIDKIESGCWVNVVNPSDEEKKFLLEEVKVLPEFIKSAIDADEAAHIDYDDDVDQRLIVVDYPVRTKESIEDMNQLLYYTEPLAFIMFKDFFVTISNNENEQLVDMKKPGLKGINTNFKTRFFLLFMLRTSQKFLVHLRQIDRLSSLTEKKLHQSMKNEELIQMLSLEKSLVFFSTSLKTDEIIMNKIMRGKTIKLYEEDQDLLEDVLIEVHQAIEMCNIYSNILSGTMDAFASVISNNLNIVMKVLTIITIVMSIPNIIFSFYGMNVEGGIPGDLWYIPLAVSVVCCVIATILFKKVKMFK